MRKTVIILHGWGVSGIKYNELQKLLEQKNYSVFAPDMPGFGTEPLLNKSMTIDDYVDFVIGFMMKKNIIKAYFIGHSFGGRVLAKLAVVCPDFVEKIVFTGSPLIKSKLSLKKRAIQFTVTKSKKIIDLLPEKSSDLLRKVIYRMLGEWDYYKANEKKETFKNIISEDASLYIDKIKQPTLVLWGENDQMVSAEIAKKIIEKIPNSKMVIVKQGGHGIPYANVTEFARYVLDFFNN